MIIFSLALFDWLQKSFITDTDMRILKLFCFLFLSSMTLVGQNIKGVIIDAETHIPIENVTVYFISTQAGTLSLSNGSFNLDINKKINRTDTLRFSILGYHAKVLSIATLIKNNYQVFLDKNPEQLDPVFISKYNALKSKLQFKKVASMQVGVYDFSSTIINDKIYVVGGNQSYIQDASKKALNRTNEIPESGFLDFINRAGVNYTWESYSDKLQIFDIKNNSWSEPAISLRKRAYHNINTFNDQLYVLGGTQLSTNKKYEYLDDKIEVLDLTSNEVLTDNTNPHPASSFASFSFEDNIIVMGGSIRKKKDNSKVYTNESHMYNLTSGYWFELPKMEKAKEASGIIIENKIYLIGGFNQTALKTIESYDITTGVWEKEGELDRGIERPALTQYNNTIYIFDDNTIQTYNVDTKTLETYQIDLFIKGAQLHYFEDYLYIIGGYSESEYTKNASSATFAIGIDAFDNTRPLHTKQMK